MSCLTQQNDRGFVNTLCETKLTRNDYEITGFADIVFCADCLHQMGRLVGMATPQETENFALKEYELSEANEKLKDEIESWKQRFEKVFDIQVEALDKKLGDKRLEPAPSISAGDA